MREVREGEPETWFPEYGARARGGAASSATCGRGSRRPTGRFAEWRAREAPPRAAPEGERP